MPDAPQPQDAAPTVEQVIARSLGGRMTGAALCATVLTDLAERGFRVVRVPDGTDAAHGDELVHVGVLIDGEFYPTEVLARHMPFATPPGTRIRPVYTTRSET